MKRITIPEPILVKDQVNGAPVPINGKTKPLRFWEWLALWVLIDPGFGKGYAADMMRAEILRVTKTSTGEVSLDDEWVKRLQAVVANPSNPPPPWVSMALLPFQKAIMEAA